MCQHFILRQFGRRRENNVQIIDGSGHRYDGGDVAPFRSCNKVELWIEIANQCHITLVEGNTLAENTNASTDQVKCANGMNIGEGACQAHASAKLCIQTSTSHKDLIWRTHHHIKARHART